MRRLILLVIVPLSYLAAADTGRLKTEVDPGRAGVFIDGKYVGPAANFKIARTYDVSPVNTRFGWSNLGTKNSLRK